MVKENKNIEQDLKNILKAVAESENIRNYDIISHNIRIQGEGFLSEFFSGEVINKNNGKTINVAIKKAPSDSFSPSFGNELLFKTEICFYSELFPKLDKFQRERAVSYPFIQIPNYLTGSIDPENMFIAMENLKTAGYVLFDKKKYFDSEHLELIFKTYGQFHALSFTFKQENAEEYRDLVEKLGNTFEAVLCSDDVMGAVEKSYSCALDTFDPITESNIFDKFKKSTDIREMLKKVQFYKGNYKCLTHGDSWSNNILFKYKESGELEDIRLIDFQMPRSSTPIYDLSYFFYSGSSKEDMDKLDYYLDCYYESFSNFAKELGGNPEEMFPLEILKKEWKEYALFGVLLSLQLWLIKLMDKDEITAVLNKKGLSADKYWELWSKKMNELRRGAGYRERAKNIFLHTVEYGIF